VPAFNMNKKLFTVILLNLIIAISYYIYHIPSGYTALSGDNNNIIPVCIKKDNPNLFQNDLFLNDLNNVKYYTPFYVDTLRFIKKITNTDYLTALKFLFIVTHFFFGLFWYLIFYKIYNNFWISLLLSLLIRGIVWLPGMEMWGISDLWTMMPRTIYSALMPLPFILLDFNNRKKLFFSAFLVGFIFNFHPITGLGGILIYLSIIFYFIIKKKIKLKYLWFIIFFVFLGMLPFVINYFKNTPIEINQKLFTTALFTRIPEYFSNPAMFIQLWLNKRFLFFIIPVFIVGLIGIRYKEYKEYFFLMLSISFLLILLPNLSVYLEKGINQSLHTNIRMSFQLLRIQKLAVLSGYLAWGFIMLYIIKNYKSGKKLITYSFILFFLFLLTAKLPVFNSVPIVGDDIVRTILPSNISFGEIPQLKGNQDLENVLTYIKEKIPKESVFVGPQVIRSATQHSVQFDNKGASMLIEGNPSRFIWWYQNRIILDTLNNQEKWNFYKNKNINYWLTKRNLHRDYIYKSNEWKLYKIQ